ncbi:kinesin-like protein KIN-4C [Silene latifolia]|uniref:kinesin-like protein KIN-4C n=1 Tax=Silene latifolia TaxID=37657 RepID=UPI003D788D72
MQQQELQERNINCELLSCRALEAHVEKDKLIMKIEAAKKGKSWDEIESDGDQAWQLGFTLSDSQGDENELEHSSLQETLDKELKELDKKLQHKEVK